MRRSALLLLSILVLAACGDDDAAPGTTTTSPSGASSTTAAPATTAGDTTTAATEFDGPSDCLEIWPEEFVTSIAGVDATFLTGSDARDACVYGLNPGIVLSYRVDTAAGFEQSRAGAGLAGGEAVDVDVCDAGYWIELTGAGIIMEGFSPSQGRAYNATITGGSLDFETWVGWGAAMIDAACGS